MLTGSGIVIVVALLTVWLVERQRRINAETSDAIHLKQLRQYWDAEDHTLRSSRAGIEVARVQTSIESQATGDPQDTVRRMIQCTHPLAHLTTWCPKCGAICVAGKWFIPYFVRHYVDSAAVSSPRPWSTDDA
jgi:hypothetical protein